MGVRETKLALDKLKMGTQWLNEAIELVKEGTLDSLLEYYQTGYIDNSIHVPSVVLIDNTVNEMVAEKITEKIREYGFYIEVIHTEGKDEFYFYYQNEKNKCKVGYIDPFHKNISFYFDFDEIERERQYKVDLLEARRNEVLERYRDIKQYLSKNDNAIKKLTNKKMIEEMIKARNNLPEEIEDIEKEVRTLLAEGKLMSEIREEVPNLKKVFYRMGFDFLEKEENRT